jgi:hypothetical protein
MTCLSPMANTNKTSVTVTAPSTVAAASCAPRKLRTPEGDRPRNLAHLLAAYDQHPHQRD